MQLAVIIYHTHTQHPPHMHPTPPPHTHTTPPPHTQRQNWKMATDGKSRIPKFSFGFRRTKVQDEPSAPSPDPPSIIRSATPTNPPASRSAESSPKVSRSKSLRLPRPTKYGLKSHSQSSITESNQNGYNGDNDLVPDVKSVKLNISRNSLSPRGRSLTVSGHMSSSSNQSSRSNSPSVSVSTGAGTEKRKLVPKSEAVQSSSQADEVSARCVSSYCLISISR